jgi:beta-glucosidase
MRFLIIRNSPILLTFAAALLAGTLGVGPQPARAAAASKHARQVDTLLSQMTLDEKIGQMVQADMNAVKDKADIAKYAFGSMLSGGDSDPKENTPQAWATAVKEFQSWALKSRLKIPLVYGVDAVHGHNNVDGAVVFPQNIGLGATRNARLVRTAGQVTAEEIAGTSIHWAFAPCVAVAQNERWGRTYESFSEDPDLAGLLGAAAVRGLEAGLPHGFHVLSCPKHFLGDGGTKDGIDQGNMVCDEATLRRLHLASYVPSIKAGAGSIMVSYSSWNGVKMHGNKRLLTDVLKKELGFQGFIVSDWAAIDQLSPNYKKAIEQSVNAGLDMAMIPNGPGQKNNYVEFIQYLKELVAENRVSPERIDDAVGRILRAKYAMGLFENPYGSPDLINAVGSAGHRKVARECVRQSLVLLKNDKRALPFSKKLQHLVVAGKAADDLGMQCGGWTVTWQGKSGAVMKGGTTILAGVREIAPRDLQVTYSAEGSNLGGADAVLVVVGEQPYAEMKGDRADLSLSVEDAALIEKCKQAGKPVVTVLLSGRPLVLGDSLDKTDALVAAWLPGTEGGGVADVLFGKAKPVGKLPRTWPRDNTQLGLTRSNPESENALFQYGFGMRY